MAATLVGTTPRGNGSGDKMADGSKVESVEVFAVDGVDSSLAMNVFGEWRAIHVAETSPKSSWP
ncbi:MAG TPA: hypothetical protein VNP92_11375 [Actinophytocola sp.]|nr:hypothetical protein [Actinophytocola sp.]